MGPHSDNLFAKWTHKYPLSKTLRFELKPVDKTKEIIGHKNLIEIDEKRAKQYDLAKKIIDEYHKVFIEEALSDFKFSDKDLEKYKTSYIKIKNSKQKDKKDLWSDFKKQKIELRKQLEKAFNQNSKYKNLFKKNLIKEDLPKWLEKNSINKKIDLDDQDPKDIITEFKDWTSYFKGFYENRKNMYSNKGHATEIISRIIEDNLPKFIDNLINYKKLCEFKNLNFKEAETGMNEELKGKTLQDVFSVSYFNLCLNQSGIDRYNSCIGGKTVNNEHIKGINQLINDRIHTLKSKANQNESNKEQLKKSIKAIRSCKMAKLYKQILSDREKTSFSPEPFKSDKELAQAVQSFYQGLVFFKDESDNKTRDLLKELKQLLDSIQNSDFEKNKMYVRGGQYIETVSRRISGQWFQINSALEKQSEQEYPKGNKLTQKIKKQREKWIKSSYFSLEKLDVAFKSYIEGLEDKKKLKADSITGYFSKYKKVITDKNNIFENIKKSYKDISLILENTEKDINLKESKDKIKLFLDHFQDLFHFIKPLYVDNKLLRKNKQEEIFEKEDAFYCDFDFFYEKLKDIIPLYNKVRNYMTKKPYSIEKFQIVFDIKNLLAGFVESKTEESDNGTQYKGYLFRKKNYIQEYDYFLGISNNAKLFRIHKKTMSYKDDKSQYERLEYYQSKKTTFYPASYLESKAELQKTVTNILETEPFKNEVSALFNNSSLSKKKEINKNNFEKLRNISNKKEKNESVLTPAFIFRTLKSCGFEKIIQEKKIKQKTKEIIKNIKYHCKKHLKQNPDLQKILDEDYLNCGIEVFEKIDEDIQQVAKFRKFSYFPVSQKELDRSMTEDSSPLYLFKITNKDLSFSDTYYNKKRKKPRGKDNLHTIYFKHLMSAEGQEVFDLGSGELFFRKASIKDSEKVIHSHTKTIRKKRKPTQFSDFKYDIIKDKRFTKDKYFFHLSIALNYKADQNKNFNSQVNEFLKTKNSDINILSIDRGERNLACWTLLDRQGCIKHADSFNVITDFYMNRKTKNKEKIKTDYQDKLDQIAKKRQDERKNWDAITNIKNLKTGYLSQVVHKISRLMIEHNAIVVFEDLNWGFKRSRFKIEKQVYQKLENMLIKKLNFLVFKDKEAGKVGGALNAYQLTNPSTTIQDLKGQTGFVFYVSPDYTSNICPLTGFVNFLKFEYKSKIQVQEFLKKFDTIRYNAQKQYFEFHLNYENFPNKWKGGKSRWTVCSYGKRLTNRKNPDKNNQWETQEYDPTQEIKKLLKNQHIDFKKSDNLKDKISEQSDTDFLKGIIYAIKMSFQIRNSRINSNEDYILSPVADKNGRFFDSRRNAKDHEPKNADENGAYHIGLKGQMILDRIKEGQTDLTIKNKHWFDFLSEKNNKNLKWKKSS